jgi:capsular polysaccharide biosynthesis protein
LTGATAAREVEGDDREAALEWFSGYVRGYSHRTVTAADVYRALWRHKWFILVLTAACVAAAWYATVQQTNRYEASALVRAQERGRQAEGNPSAALQASQELAQTYARLIGSGALREDMKTLVASCTRPTARVARASSCEWLVGRRRAGLAPGTISSVKLTAENVQDLDLLSITARSENPRDALVAAAAAPDALRRFIRRTAPPSEGVVTVKAPTSSSLVSQHLALNVTIAFMLGLIFSGALALLLELLRDRLPEADELEVTVGHPVLATIPTLRLRQRATPPQAGMGAAGPTGEYVDSEEAASTAGSGAAPGRRA